MKNRNRQQGLLVVEKVFDVSPGMIWSALTDNAKLKQWYFDIEAFEPVEGFEFIFYGENKGQKFKHICKVLTVVPQEKLSYTWDYENYTGSSVVTFEIFADAGRSKLVLSHTGLNTFPDQTDFARSNFEQGWDYIIGTSLKNFLEKEKDYLE